MGEIIEVGQFMIDFITTDSYTYLQEFVAWMTIKVVIFYFTIKLYSLQFFWGVGLSIIDQLSISTYINQYWGLLDSQVLALATFLKIPEGLNFLMNARITRFIMDLF